MAKPGVAIHWFRHGLRLHDMPSLVSILEDCESVYPVFIFDGETAGTKLVGYNRMRFLLEALHDLDDQFKDMGGRLFVFFDNPVTVFEKLFKKWHVTHLSYEQDPEPIWQKRDNDVNSLCHKMGIKVVEKVSHTLWDPKEVIEMNGGTPPLTYAQFVHVVEAVGLPPRPLDVPNFAKTKFPIDNEESSVIPSPEDLGVVMECPEQSEKVWTGGETRALQHLKERLSIEEKAYKEGYYMPNQFQPDLVGPPMSMSAALRFGCLSVRRFYWSLHDLHQEVCPDRPNPSGLTGQLIWREYFYTMSVNNMNYASMEENPCCVNIPWKSDDEILNRWKEGQTGYPFIDACMRQLMKEGWIHHVARNAVACFLTRGDLWVSWVDGLQVFLKHLIDADWSVCAGNWMWVSSSAFENVLQCSYCVSPVYYGRRLEPTGEYIRRYVPVLKDMPTKYLYDPWNAPIEVQEKANCIVGKDYPVPMVDHERACAENTKYMNEIRDYLMGQPIAHCAPSSHDETRAFLWLPEKCMDTVHPCTD